MKKILLSLICVILLFGCGSKKDNVTIDNNQHDNDSKTIDDEKNMTDGPITVQQFDTYEFYIGVDENDKHWYISVPYLNEINRGNVYMLANGDNWWLGIVNDFNKTNCSIEEAVKLVFDLYFSGIKGYFYVDDNGFVESSSYKEKHSGIEMLKVEGTATNGKFESIGECWIYGYIFMLGDTPCGILGMNNKDKSEESKDTIKMYLDAMVDTLVLK